MAHSFKHAVSSARKFGGMPEDYVEIHSWFDSSKAFVPNLKHRALHHHAQGIFFCERLFGVTLRNAAGQIVPVRCIAEQHVIEDLGRIPTVQDWLAELPVRPWMYGRKLDFGGK